jgi:hypothetical protein
MHLNHSPLCHLPSAICDSSEIKPMHLNQTSTATLPCSSPLDFPLDGGCRPRAFTRRPLDAIAFLATDTEHTKEALKATYLECLKDVKSKAETLRQTVIGLLDLGVPSQQLSAWAKAAGRNDRYSQKLVSQIFLDLGIRRRAPGSGPRLPREAYLVESQIRHLYGEHTLKFLRAACHVAKARDEGELPEQQIPE